MGDSCSELGESCFALGESCFVLGESCFALGEYCIAIGETAAAKILFQDTVLFDSRLGFLIIIGDSFLGVNKCPI